MALTPGTRLGVYDIIAAIGEGGMGAVFRARDAKLERDVAIKILPEAFAHDADRLARFTREAKTLASLNRPHIAAIHGLEESDGITALVMELVEGEDLSQRIAQGAIPIDEALPIAKQIAEALEAAHEQGIIHRDLKPANIKVRSDGTVKVLDFGLAKAMEPAAGSSHNVSQSPTLTSPAMTQAGVILGTAAYMAPEQARGKAVDKRADIWAFGAVLYEMLTGARAFNGENVADVLSRVLQREPDLAALPPATPARVRALVARCLVKDPRQRVRDMGDVRLALDGAFDTSHVSQTMGPPATAGRGGLAWMVAAGVATALLAALSIIHFREAPPVTPLVQTEMPLPDGVVPGFGALSPDGTRLVVRGTPRGGRPQLYLRSLGGRAFAPIPDSETSGPLPFWSPDSQWVAFSAGGKLLKWNVTGGQPPQVICSGNASYGTWGDGDVILFSEDGKPLQRVPAAGGVAQNALELDTAFGELSHTGPSFLPGGKAFLFGSNGAVRGAQFFATLDGTVRRRLPDNARGVPQWVANPSGGGFLAYTIGAQLFVRPFDPATGEFTSEAVLLVDDVVSGPTASFGGAGRLVYQPVRTSSTQLRWYDGNGQAGDTVGEPGVLAGPQLSPDGTRVVFNKQDSGRSEVWVLPAGGGVGERVASTGSGVTRLGPALWTPDGRILYSRLNDQAAEVVERPADALGSDSVVARVPGNAFPSVRGISADGREIVMSTNGGGESESFLLARHGGAIRPANLPPRARAVLSPDGRWLAHFSPTGTGVFVRTVPDDPTAPVPSGERQLASIPTPIQQMQWSADGRELFILAGAAQRVMMVLPIVWTDGTPRPGALRTLFDTVARSFATADGRRFLVADLVGGAETPIAPMILVQNWPALLAH